MALEGATTNRFIPVATRAIYTFIGFAGAPLRHLYLHHDGYPTGAAWRFATALRHDPAATAFLAAFLRTQPQAEALTHPDQAADADYRYVVVLLPGPDPVLQVQCWRRLPQLNRWSPRCKPLAMALFIQRFLPGDMANGAECSGATSADRCSETAAGQG